MNDHFILGINYWPRKKAMYWWKDFDEREVEKEFEEIQSLGLKLVRIFLLWEDFQPYPSEVYRPSLENLKRVLEIADSKNLRVMPTLFTGHMSGVNWVPYWALADKKISDSPFRTISRNKVKKTSIGYFYRNPRLIKAQMKLVRSLVPAVQNAPSLFGWDLGNEPSILLKPKSVSDLRFWTRTLSQEMRKLDPLHPITLGIHQGDLSYDTKFHPGCLSPYLDFSCMHGYPNYSSWAKGPTDYKALSFLNFLTENLAHQKVLFAEFGLPVPPNRNLPGLKKQTKQFYASDKQATFYTRNALTHLHRIGSLGTMLWCFSDYHPRLKDMPPFDQAPHELYFGITRYDGSLKGSAYILKKWVQKERKVLPSPPHRKFQTPNYFSVPEKNLKKMFQKFLNSHF